jgi:hypothetical protein
MSVVNNISLRWFDDGSCVGLPLKVVFKRPWGFYDYERY